MQDFICGRTLTTKGTDMAKRPAITPFMESHGLEWRWIGDEWHMVCNFCGGNCGQCGMTNIIGNVPASMDTMAANLLGQDKMNKSTQALMLINRINGSLFWLLFSLGIIAFVAIIIFGRH